VPTEQMSERWLAVVPLAAPRYRTDEESRNGHRVAERPHPSAFLQVGRELAALCVPPSILDAFLDVKRLPVHGNARDEVARVEPRPVREDASSLRGPNRHAAPEPG